jgi:TrmH family RNA methyltransferase
LILSKSFNSITSKNNELIKSRCRLNKPRERKKSGLFIVAGPREIKKALEAGFTFYEFFFAGDIINSEESDLLKCISKDKIYEIPGFLMDKLSPRSNCHGLVGIAAAREYDFYTTALEIVAENKKNSLFVVLEKPEKPGNIGAVLRTCDALGVNMLVLCDTVCDMFSPNVIRSSLGCYFTVPWAITSSVEALNFFKQHNITQFASTPSAKTNLWELNLQVPAALVMGSEKDGLSDIWLGNPLCTKFKIPMAGAADSLNLAQFSSLAIYEAVRQRISVKQLYKQL